MIQQITSMQGAVLIAGYLILLGTSGILVNYILSRISKEPIKQKISEEARDTGFVIGNVKIS